ncbi:hypothetical protein TRFO_17838 [Tritrichomonas foetus]|uniref:Rap-GAP domain-containing protein n=1 Tax=Tritrichomonas foetus TaxID=1144522 RepID=A0A1J4KN82_9EUKA|nr:hypothetical protein TRFO_17838 [Tritrichomonas foetus]|eukprot:OHT12360.1 hypothetical protein TRFO_17838 [Tritrichomonas foetus]
MKKIGPLLDNLPVLMDPSYGDIPGYTSVLSSYSNYEKQSIVDSILKCFLPSNPQYKSLSKNAFDYANLVVPYALRYDDEKDGNNSFFLKAFNLYFHWIEGLPFETDDHTRQAYIQKFLIHLSQIFLNPSFKPHINKFCENIKQLFLSGAIHIGEETKTVLIKVLICGCIDIQKSQEFKILAALLVDTVLLYVSNADDGWFNPFLPRIQPLFQLSTFLAIVTKKFAQSYSSFIKSPNPLAEKILNFLRFLISTYFPPKEKHEALDKAIGCCIQIELDNSKMVTEVKKLFKVKWQTETIKSLFFSWFSIDYECAPSKLRRPPIFDLLKHGEPETNPDLQKIAENIIIRMFSQPEKSNIFWFIPVFSKSFFRNHPMFLIDNNHYEIIFQYIEKLKGSQLISNIKIVNSTIKILNLLLQLSISLNRPDLIDRVSNCLNTLNVKKFPNIALYISYCHFSARKIDLLWNLIHSSINDPVFAQNSYLFYLFAAFYTLFSENIFKYYSITQEFWTNIIQSIQRSEGNAKDLYYLALFTFARNTDIFKQFPESGSIFSNLPNDKMPSNSYAYYLKTAIIAGPNNELLPKQPYDYKDEKFFVTARYIISIVNNNTVRIRSPLGICSFDIKKESGHVVKPIPYVPQKKEPGPKINFVPENAQGKEISQLLSQIPDNLDFTPYQPIPKKDPCFDSFCFLSDLGLFSTKEAETAKLVSSSYLKHIIDIDTISAKAYFEVSVMQAIGDNETLVSSKTSALIKLLTDICPGFQNGRISNALCDIQYIIPCLMKPGSSRKTQILLLLNETDFIIRKYNQEIAEYDYVIIVKPMENDLYYVKIFSHQIVFAPFGSFHIIHRTQICELITFLIMLYNATPPESRKVIRGPMKFIERMSLRTNRIFSLFNQPKISPQEVVHVFSGFSNNS